LASLLDGQGPSDYIVQAPALTVDETEEKIYQSGEKKRGNEQQSTQSFAQCPKKLPKWVGRKVFTAHWYTA